jgi:hypothetical protein
MIERTLVARGNQRRAAPSLGHCELADLDASEYDSQRSGLWTRGLLIRRTIADGDLAFFTTWCPAGTGIATLVKVEGHRWAIEDSFETAKNELGLDHNETHSAPRLARHARLRDDGRDPAWCKYGATPANESPDLDRGSPPRGSLLNWSKWECQRSCSDLMFFRMK